MAAVRLALDKGLDAVTVEAISEAADISPRTFFNYFAAKDDALTVDPVLDPEEVAGALAARPVGEPVMASFRIIMRDVADKLTRAFAALGPVQELHRRYPELARRGNAVDQQQLMTTMLGVVRERMGDDDGLRARLMLIAPFGVTLAAVQEAMENPEGPSVEELLTRAFDLLEEGL